MADFKIALAWVLRNEGTAAKPYDNDRSDSGNWIGQKLVQIPGGGQELRWVAEIGVGIVAGTKWGITALEVREYYGRPITADDVKNMPDAVRDEIYARKYWRVIRGDEINDQETANEIMDFGVNTGVVNGIKKWQRAQGLPETGEMDELTMQNINE